MPSMLLVRRLFPSLSLSLCGLTWLSSAQYLFRRSLKMNGRNKTKLSLRRVLTFTHRLFSFKWHSFEMHSTAIFHSLWTCGQDLVSLWAGSSWKGREGTVLYPLSSNKLVGGVGVGCHKESPHPPSLKPITSPSQTVFCRLSLRPIFGLRFIRSKDGFCFVTYFSCEYDFLSFFSLLRKTSWERPPLVPLSSAMYHSTRRSSTCRFLSSYRRATWYGD